MKMEIAKDKKEATPKEVILTLKQSMHNKGINFFFKCFFRIP